MTDRIEQLKKQISGLPSGPGVYQYFNKDGLIIYVGKAKNLKKRVASYFNKNHENNKTAILVAKIFTIKHIVVSTEQDALLLENNLIKKYQPRYNVLLKDDKSFPWICIKNEPFPRVFSTRHFVKDGSEYFGPFTSVRLVRIILDLVKQLYKLRTCNHNLSIQNIDSKKFKICLEHHLGNCYAPCVGKQSEQEYLKAIEDIRKILKGNIHSVITYMKSLMQDFAEDYKFEEAQHVKDKLVLLEKFQSRSTIVSPTLNNIDVFSFESDDNNGYINFLKVVNGAIIQSHTIELKKKLNESKEELLTLAVIDIRRRLFSNSTEIILPFPVDYQIEGAKITIPKRGEKRMLLDLSLRNAKYFALDRRKQESEPKKEKRETRVLNRMRDDLQLKELPIHIECFDNSNIQGTYPVASCVVFKNGKPSKRDYRHFNIKTVVGPDDFGSMKEVIMRRYTRLLNEGQTLPQLIIVDGGKGQLSAAVEGLDEINLRGKISIIGIAKRLEEIYFPTDPVPLYLDKNSESLKLIQFLRNEAHRFAIGFHRDKRSADFIKSELEEIPGFGPATISKLLTHFKSVANVKKASEKELVEIIGTSKYKMLHSFYKK